MVPLFTIIVPTYNRPSQLSVCLESLTQLEEEFAGQFLRVHRNALVAMTHVTGLQRDADGRTSITFDGMDDQVEVSRRLLASVRKALKSGA